MSFAVSQYQTNQVQTASPARVIVAYYNGALRFLRSAIKALEARDYAAKGMYLSRAHAVVSELSANLDPQHAPDLCAQLEPLYGFVLACISEANMHADASKLTPAINVLEQLKGAWEQVAEEPTGVVIVGTP